MVNILNFSTLYSILFGLFFYAANSEILGMAKRVDLIRLAFEQSDLDQHCMHAQFCENK